ncbi:hypothetical protein TYM08_P0724 [Marinicellulosiphila megalodicopiae]
MRFFRRNKGLSTINVRVTPKINAMSSHTKSGASGLLKSKKDKLMGWVFSLLNPIAMPIAVKHKRISQNFSNLNSLIMVRIIDQYWR